MNQYKPVTHFVTSVFDASTDIRFWNSQINKIVSEYKEEADERELFLSMFTIFNVDNEFGNGNLHQFVNQDVVLTSKNLDTRKKQFFRWLRNSAILNVYNSMEILIQRVIFEDLKGSPSDFFGKKEIAFVNKEVNEYIKTNSLGKFDTKNNRHLIKYLSSKSSETAKFLTHKVKTNFKSNWGDLFELVSILRNVIAHQTMMIEPDTYNAIKSCSKDIFSFYFDTPESSTNMFYLESKGDHINSFINLLAELTINLVKFFRNETDLKFAGFLRC